MTGGEALVKMLNAHGVELGFGMGGFQALPYYDALTRQDSLRHVLIRDEKDGAFAADAYARIANRPAVIDATLGPGATNLVSGLAESQGASIPMLALTGEVNADFAGRGGTQESDQVGMLSPAAKASISIESIARVPELTRRAISIATGGRPGPVHLNIRENVFHATASFEPSEFYAHPGSELVGGRRARPEAAAVDAAVALLRDAERPVAIAGGGVHLSQAYEEVLRFVEATRIPLATTISGKGALREDHELSVGLCGRYSRSANDLIEEADVLVVVGSKLGEIATNRWAMIGPQTKLIQIDVDVDELGHYYSPTVPLWGDAREALRDLNDALEAERGELPAASRARAERIADGKAKWFATAAESYTSDEQPINVARLLAELRGVLPGDGILVADGGFAAHWSALLFDVTQAGRTYIANRGHAAIGYGLPGAIGAKLAAPDSPVVALCGDNGFAMAMGELETALRCKAPVVCAVVNNRTLGYVKALQHALYDDRFISVDFEEVDYAAIAEANGCVGIRIDDPADLAAGFERALGESVPVVLDIRTTTDPAKMLPGVDSRTAAASAD
jgi:acetolactate synthase-1/2/3 large subunit